MSEPFGSEAINLAYEHCFDDLRNHLHRDDIYFREELEGMDDEELYNAWTASGDDEIKEMIDEDNFSRLRSADLEEERGIQQLEDIRQDV